MPFPSKRSTNTTDTGDAAKYGGADLNAICDYLVTAALTNQSNTWGNFNQIFLSGRLHILNPAQTADYYIHGGSIVDAVDLILPTFSGTDYLVAQVAAATLSNKILDSSCDISDALTAITVPGTQSGATVDINTTASETDLLNYTIPGGAMCINGSARFRITGYLLQNQATGTTFTFIVKFGGTNLISCISPSVAQSATKLPFRIEGELYNKNATNANAASTYIVVNTATPTITTGIGSIADDTILFSGNSSSEGADTTKDTTINQTLQVTVTMSVNNAAVHTVVEHKQVQVSQFT